MVSACVVMSRVLCNIFDVPSLKLDLLQDAYAETQIEAEARFAAQPMAAQFCSADCQLWREVDVSKFMSWYVKNMFCVLAQLTAAPDRLAWLDILRPHHRFDCAALSMLIRLWSRCPQILSVLQWVDMRLLHSARVASENLVGSVASRHGIAPAVVDKIKR
eukprot:26957-Amphidinium_carterae.1